MVPTSTRIAGMTIIAPASAKKTDITVTVPKLLMIPKVEIMRAAKPKTVVIPDTVIAVPICWMLWRMAGMSAMPFCLSS